MEAFKSTLPEGKVVDHLEDLGAFTVKELKSILKQYNERTSGVKVDLVLRTFAVFCRAKNVPDKSSDISDESLLYCCEKEWTYSAIYEQCKHLPWTSDLCGTPNFSFLQLLPRLHGSGSKVLRIKMYRSTLPSTL